MLRKRLIALLLQGYGVFSGSHADLGIRSELVIMGRRKRMHRERYCNL